MLLFECFISENLRGVVLKADHPEVLPFFSREHHYHCADEYQVITVFSLQEVSCLIRENVFKYWPPFESSSSEDPDGKIFRAEEFHIAVDLCFTFFIHGQGKIKFPVLRLYTMPALSSRKVELPRLGAGFSIIVEMIYSFTHRYLLFMPDPSPMLSRIIS
jgi:hypothetical protein